MIGVSASIHAFGHYMSYSCCAWIYDPVTANRQRGNIFYTSWEAMFFNKYGITGHLITLVMLIMFASSMKQYRRSKFEFFF
jgi:DMSO/TMAO reductase YedYZ heme-binding membrane subunit